MSDSNYRSLDADRAIQSSKDDHFGFAEIARKLAKSVVSAATQQGMVIAIEGKWGSGKSSLVNLLEREIERDNNNNTSIIPFSPWLVGDKDNLVITLLSAIATACEKTGIDSNQPKTRFAKLCKRISKTKTDATKIAEGLRSFSVAASQKLSPILSLASVVEPTAAIASGVLKKGTDVLETLAPDKTLDYRKSALSKQLSSLPHRFVVVVDDIDRLEPQQAIEVLRLVRSVADFPNMIYVLCYDKEILADAIQQSLGVPNGEAYLQKIIQVSFNIPRPEPFDLRRLLRDDLTKLYKIEIGEHPDRDTLIDLEEAVDTVGFLMQTPREVKTILNSIKFYFPPVKDDVYFPDLCWLHLRRILHPELYNWIEHYLTEWAVISRGDARAGSDEVNRLSKQLGEILNVKEVDSLRSVWSIKDYIPGVEPRTNEGERPKIFIDPSDDELQNLKRRKRLGSPDHYRFYFAFAAPRTALTDSEFASIMNLANNDRIELEEKLIGLSEGARPTGGSWFDYFIDQMKRENFEEWNNQHLSAFSHAISNIMDTAMRSNESARFMGRTSVSRRAGTVCFKMLQSLKSKSDETQYTEALRDILESGASIGWLTEEFLSSELWRHGKAGDRPKPESEWFLSDTELENAREIILRRLKKPEDRQKLSEYPDIASLLFRWKEIDHNNLDDPKKWFAEQSFSDSDFVSLLQKMRGFSGSSEGISYPLRRPDVAPFCDWDAVKSRLENIATSDSNERTLTVQAKELLEAIRENI